MSYFVCRDGKAELVPAGEKDRRRISAVGWALLVVLMIQLAVICFFNLTQMRNHVGFDSSWNYLRASLMWDEKTLYSSAWSETTDLSLDNLLPAAALLYGITGNILLSFGIANILMVLLLLFFMWRIMDRLQVGFTAKMIAQNLVICPFMTTGFSQFNDLGYFSNILSGASYYSMRVLFVLMIIYEFLKIVRDRKIGVFGWLLFPACLLSGFSSGIYLIVMLFIPYIAYELEMTVIRSDWKQLIRKESLFAYGCCASVLAGKALASMMIHFEAMDSSRTWTPLTRIWQNLGAVFQGFMKLLQVLPDKDPNHLIMSFAGIMRVFILVVFVILLTAVFSFIRRTVKNPTEKDGACLFLINIVGLNFLVLGLFNVSYGDIFFEERYLVTTFFVIILITALFFDGLDERKTLSVMLSVAMTGSILMVDVHSDINYLRTTNDAWQINEIQELAESEGAGLVYFWGDDLIVVGKTMRACDLNRIYKELPDEGGSFVHWGDYTTYDRNEDYRGKTMLICLKEQNPVPKHILREYTLLQSLNDMDVYICDHNPRMF